MVACAQAFVFAVAAVAVAAKSSVASFKKPVSRTVAPTKAPVAQPTAVRCPRGKYYVQASNYCGVCARGFYTERPDLAKCTPCGPGETTAEEGAYHPDWCYRSVAPTPHDVSAYREMQAQARKQAEKLKPKSGKKKFNLQLMHEEQEEANTLGYVPLTPAPTPIKFALRTHHRQGPTAQPTASPTALGTVPVAARLIRKQFNPPTSIPTRRPTQLPTVLPTSAPTKGPTSESVKHVSDKAMPSWWQSVKDQLQSSSTPGLVSDQGRGAVASDEKSDEQSVLSAYSDDMVHNHVLDGGDEYGQSTPDGNMPALAVKAPHNHKPVASKKTRDGGDDDAAFDTKDDEHYDRDDDTNTR